MNNNECSKYEGLFIFGSEEALREHLITCSHCRKEHSEMEEIAGIVKEVKPFIRKKAYNNDFKMKLVAGFIFIFIAFFAIKPILINSVTNLDSGFFSNEESSSIADMGLPTDEYGLLRIE